MTTYKVAELEGVLLDAAVAIALGATWPGVGAPLLRDVDDILEGLPWYEYKDEFRPSVCWSHGGPIIERECIGLQHWGGDRGWLAGHCKSIGPGVADGRGATPLIAAMRCVVAGKFGATVTLGLKK